MGLDIRPKELPMPFIRVKAATHCSVISVRDPATHLRFALMARCLGRTCVQQRASNHDCNKKYDSKARRLMRVRATEGFFTGGLRNAPQNSTCTNSATISPVSR